jgi:putative addiction module component (TIGR02574 family)
MTKAALLAEIMLLPPDERLDLVEEIYQSLPAAIAEEMDITPEQIAEVRRRLTAHDQNPARASSWEDVKARLDARYKP